MNNGFTGRYASLDLWRGVASLWVMLHHNFGNVMEHGVSVHSSLRWLLVIAEWGWLGVPLFFVISGYCIASNVYRIRNSTRTSTAFFRDRCLRIYPTYWAACLLAGLLCLVCAPFSRLPASDALPGSLLQLVCNVFLLEPYFGLEEKRYLLVAWTLWYELGFYAMFAGALFLRRKGVRTLWLVACGVGLAVLGTLNSSHFGLFYLLRHWGIFLCGALVFLALLRQETHNREPMAILAVVGSFAVVGSLWLEGLERIGFLAGAGFSIALFLLHKFDTRISSAKWFRWLGAVGIFSYSLYLSHIPIGGRAVNFLTRLFPETSASYLIVQFGASAAAIGGAWLLYRFCEEPMERLRRQLQKGRPLDVPVTNPAPLRTPLEAEG